MYLWRCWGQQTYGLLVIIKREKSSTSWGLRDGFAVKSTNCSCRGPWFSFHYSQLLSITPEPEDTIPSSGIHRQAKHEYIQKWIKLKSTQAHLLGAVELIINHFKKSSSKASPSPPSQTRFLVSRGHTSLVLLLASWGYSYPTSLLISHSCSSSSQQAGKQTKRTKYLRSPIPHHSRPPHPCLEPQLLPPQ